MADQVTKPEDVIVPELFTQYVLEETTEKSEIVASGAVENNPILDGMLSGGGSVTFTMPKWEDLGGTSDVFTAKKGSETKKVGSHAEIGVKLLRESSWGFHDLAHSFAADDPAREFAARVGKWWRRDEKRNLMAILKGVIASDDMKDHVLDITGESNSTIDAKQILDTKQLMGDAADELSLIYMHSAVFTELQKQQLIVYRQATDADIRLATYLGYTVICDDSAPVETSDKDKFTTFLLARGCIQRGIGTPPGFVGTEVKRDADIATTKIYTRQSKILHPKGLTWNARASDLTYETPTDEELAKGEYWAKATDDLKNVGIVALVHHI